MDPALDLFAEVHASFPVDNWFAGMAEANQFAAAALAGRHERARALLPATLDLLPAAGRGVTQGLFYAVDACVTGQTHLGERAQCAALYPLALDYVRTGQVVSALVVGPSSPQLAAALAADAGGLTERSREHFELALRQSLDTPTRILQPTVRYWYGRALAASGDESDRARGRALVEAALVDFRSLEMGLHAGLAEAQLRGLSFLRDST